MSLVGKRKYLAWIRQRRFFMAKQPAKTANSRRSRSSKKSGGTFWRILGGFLLVVLVMLTGIGCGFLTASMNTRPNLAEDLTPSASSQIYDINGNEIANIRPRSKKLIRNLCYVVRADVNVRQIEVLKSF